MAIERVQNISNSWDQYQERQYLIIIATEYGLKLNDIRQ